MPTVPTVFLLFLRAGNLTIRLGGKVALYLSKEDANITLLLIVIFGRKDRSLLATASRNTEKLYRVILMMDLICVLLAIQATARTPFGIKVQIW